MPSRNFVSRGGWPQWMNIQFYMWHELSLRYIQSELFPNSVYIYFLKYFGDFAEETCSFQGHIAYLAWWNWQAMVALQNNL